MNDTYDVIAVNVDTRKVTVISAEKSANDADAIVSMAVIRRGCNKDVFVPVKHDEYKDGDVWPHTK